MTLVRISREPVLVRWKAPVAMSSDYFLWMACKDWIASLEWLSGLNQTALQKRNVGLMTASNALRCDSVPTPLTEFVPRRDSWSRRVKAIALAIITWFLKVNRSSIWRPRTLTVF